MSDLTHQLEKADRLASITQKIGFALWQFQELEGVSAQYFVLLAQASRGMGQSEGIALVEKAQRKSFGATIHQLAKADLLNEELEAFFGRLLVERNWLVHRSRADSRNAIHSVRAMQQLVTRLDSMADGALQLLTNIGSLTEAHVKKHGVTEGSIESMASELLAQWHTSEPN